jgi:tryptophan 2,3-dioxygenase
MSLTQNRKSSLDRALRQASSDYARYVGTELLFSCQRTAEVQVNADELAFQIVHQVEELWMKLAAHTLIDIEADLRTDVSASSILRRFARVSELLALMSEQLAVLATMSPTAYAEIRGGLGQGSGQDSPGYRALIKHAEALWPAFHGRYLAEEGSALIDQDTDGAAFAIAEAMLGLDIGLARFRHAHLQLVDRMIGLTSLSLKGLPAAALVGSVDRRLFPELWAVRQRSIDSPAPDPGRTENHAQREGADDVVAPARRKVFTQADWP